MAYAGRSHVRNRPIADITTIDHSAVVPFAILAVVLLGLMFAAPPSSFFVKRRWLALWTVGLIGGYTILPFVPREAEPFGSGGAEAFVLGGLYLVGALINVTALIGRYLREMFGSESYR